MAGLVSRWWKEKGETRKKIKEKKKKREQVWLALLSDKPMSNGPPRMNLAKLSKPSSDDGKYYYCTIHIKTSWLGPKYVWSLLCLTTETWMNPVKADDASVSAMIDTLNNSIQSLTFGKKWIQFNAWFNIDGNNMKNNCGDSIQWIIQFNSYETGWIRMVPKKCPTNKMGLLN